MPSRHETQHQAESQETLVPYVPSGMDETDTYPPFPFPDLGAFMPDGWDRAEQNWVVETGNGGDTLAATARRSHF